MEPKPDTSYEEQAEQDSFSQNAKSSVKITKNSKGINWEIKVVTGEKDLIEGLMTEAVKTHKALESKLNGGNKNE